MSTKMKAKAVRNVRPITITMSDEEAKALMTVLRSVGGAPSGPRGLIDNIRKALVSVGIEHVNHFAKPGNGTIYIER